MSTSPNSAYLLISHGSRDPRPAATMEDLAQQMRDRSSHASQASQSDPSQPLPNPPLVGTAQLELAALSLHEQIIHFAQIAASANCDELQLVPLFLLPGVHVMEDIPTEISKAQAQISPRLRLLCCPHIGKHPGLVTLLNTYQQASDADAWILLSHGSRRPGGNQPIQHLSQRIQAAPAYWSVPPHLPDVVADLVQQGHSSIGILPYFLFAGSITDAIAQMVTELDQQFPDVTVHLAPTLEQSPILLDCIEDLTQSWTEAQVGT
jgi:sirohydrochlorin ferrochelatase